MIEAISGLHWLRPLWLWALLALPLLWFAWRARRKRESVWRRAVDPHLLPYLLERGGPAARSFGIWAAVCYVLAVLALAGPSWRQIEQPLWQTRAPLMIALDLSSATLAADLPPSRLLQARAKLAALLRERAGGQVGLVAYADDAFTVAPLTDDSRNVALFLDSLAPDVMPTDGNRADRAIDMSAKLLKQAGFEQGDILLVTDHADADAIAAARRAARAGYRVSALGMGTAAGAAYRDAAGTIGHAELDAASLRALAGAAGGRYAGATADSGDLQALGVLDPQQSAGASGRGERGRHWQDDGYWLLPPLLLLSLFAFRRGGGAAMAALLLCAMLPWSPAQAAGQEGWWRRPDQQAHRKMEQGAEAYRKNDFASAQQAWRGLSGADAQYNLGNALAKTGQYPEAIAAYDRALRAQPGMQDALANKRAVEAAMKRKPPKGGKQDDKGGQGQGKNPKSEQDQNGQSQSQQAQPQSGGQESQQKPPQSQQKQNAASQPQQAQPKPQDPNAQQAADAAQRERMRRALAEQGKASQQAAKEPQSAQETPAERERRQANEAWLRRVPDDPGGLLRAKFRLEQERRQQSGSSP